ncbi:MAG: hypothetical protein AB8B63_16370 [Granulosicoccus sp.]
MLRYLPGIVLIQLVTVTLFWVNQSPGIHELLLRVVLPASAIACVTAFWFFAIARTQSEKLLNELREAHSKEREKLSRKLERTRSDVLQQASAEQARIVERAHVEREKLVKQTHKDVLRNERSASRRASMKVGLAFAGVAVMGVIMLISEFLTLGLMTLTTAGGALGGYLLRWRHTASAPTLPPAAELPVLESLPADDADFETADKLPGRDREILKDPTDPKILEKALLAEPDRISRGSGFFRRTEN